MSDEEEGPGIVGATVPPERRIARRIVLPGPSLAESLAMDACAAIAATLPGARKLWGTPTWERVRLAMTDSFAKRLRGRIKKAAK